MYKKDTELLQVVKDPTLKFMNSLHALSQYRNEHYTEESVSHLTLELTNNEEHQEYFVKQFAFAKENLVELLDTYKISFEHFVDNRKLHLVVHEHLYDYHEEIRLLARDMYGGARPKPSEQPPSFQNLIRACTSSPEILHGILMEGRSIPDYKIVKDQAKVENCSIEKLSSVEGNLYRAALQNSTLKQLVTDPSQLPSSVTGIKGKFARKKSSFLSFVHDKIVYGVLYNHSLMKKYVACATLSPEALKQAMEAYPSPKEFVSRTLGVYRAAAQLSMNNVKESMEIIEPTVKQVY